MRRFPLAARRGAAALALAAAFAAGFIRSTWGSYTSAFLIAGLFGLLAALLLAISARRPIAVQST